MIAETLAVFVVLGVPLAVGVATAAEYGRALKLRSEVQEAADVAVATAVAEKSRGVAAMRAVLKATFDTHLRPALRAVLRDADIRDDVGRVFVSVPLTVTTTLSALYGNRAFHFTIDSSAVRPEGWSRDRAQVLPGR